MQKLTYKDIRSAKVIDEYEDDHVPSAVFLVNDKHRVDLMGCGPDIIALVEHFPKAAKTRKYLVELINEDVEIEYGDNEENEVTIIDKILEDLKNEQK